MIVRMPTVLTWRTRLNIGRCRSRFNLWGVVSYSGSQRGTGFIELDVTIGTDSENLHVDYPGLAGSFPSSRGMRGSY